jgi:xylan 1,4-beta-xylosidase
MYALRNLHLSACSLLLAFSVAPSLAAQTASTEPVSIQVNVNAKDAGTPFPHFWEQTFGSGRAILSLRDSYHQDIHAVKQATDFRYVRFHAIFHDEVGLFNRDASGKPFYNFSYIDQIYDGLLQQGVRPFVELSFMPKQLASDPAALHAFWYKQNVSPPKDYAEWDAMIQAFTQHLVDRYGIDEVSQWYFEVWNEPNIDFWVGKPAQSTYFELYDHTALAVKAVSPRLRVGGPATAQAAWVPDFIAHTKQNNVPVDFISTHVYANDTAKDVFKTDENIPRDAMVCRSVRKVHDEIAASTNPSLPLFFSEYNASYSNEPNVTDSVYMGPWLATTISQCDGLAQMMSYWSFSDVFEEQGVVKTPFYGGFGLMAEDNIPKPAFNAFAMLHRLGDVRLPVASSNALATRRKDGSLAIALWNYATPAGAGPKYISAGPEPPPANFTLSVSGVAPAARVTLWLLDTDHGNVVKTFDAMGRPAFPTREQIRQLQAAGTMAPPQTRTLHNGKLTLAIPRWGLVLAEIR